CPDDSKPSRQSLDVCLFRSCAFPTAALEEFQLRPLEKIIVLKDADDLEQVGFLVVAVGLGFTDQAGKHGLERYDGINAFSAKQRDALLACLLALGESRNHQNLQRCSVLAKRARSL